MGYSRNPTLTGLDDHDRVWLEPPATAAGWLNTFGNSLLVNI